MKPRENVILSGVRTSRFRDVSEVEAVMKFSAFEITKRRSDQSILSALYVFLRVTLS